MHTGSARTNGGAHLALDELPGRSVLDSSGRVIGRVDQALVDMESWAVDSLRVRLHREAANELGMSWSPFRPPSLDVPTGLVLAARDAVILRAGLDELASLVPEQEHHEREAEAAEEHERAASTVPEGPITH